MIAGEFGPVISLKGEILDSWKAARVNMPVRSYERYTSDKAIKPTKGGHDFGFPNDDKMLTEHYRKFKKEHLKKFEVSL